MNKRSIWILNHYAGTPDAPGPTRHLDLATRLVRRGYRVAIVGSSRRWIQADPSKRGRVPGSVADIDGVRLISLSSAAGARGNDATRVVNMLEFAWRLWREGRSRFHDRATYPDVVVGSTPHLLTPLAAWLLARRFRARFVIEVRDLWPETLVAFGLYGPRHPLVLALRRLERFLYRRADRIVTLLPEARLYFEEQAAIPREDVVWIPNGAAPGAASGPTEAADRPFTVMYAGSEGRANVLEDFLAAARILQDRGTLLRVVLVGDGMQRQALEARAKELSLANVVFLDAVRKKDLAGLLAQADVCIALLEDASVYRYGVSLNKLFEYMALARPVIFAGRTAHNYVDLAGCGLVVPPRDPTALARAIADLKAMSSAERRAMGERGLEYVRRHHDWDLLADRFAGVVEETEDRGGGRVASNAAKRLLDLGVSVMGVAFLLLPLAFAALAVKLEDGGPVFFRQERVGKGGKLFRVWKFRTMVVGAMSKGLGVTVAAGDDRITRVGQILRSLGVDELPQVLNVIAGDMSLVGPRPTLAYQVEHYDATQRRRLEVRPGITSLAVVSGRNALSWKERIELDVWYIDHWSLGLDLKILFRTLWCVLITREGLYGEDGVNDSFVDPDREGEKRA